MDGQRFCPSQGDSDVVTLDARARQRLLVLTLVLAGERDTGAARTYLQLSTRQVRRQLERYRVAGAAALVHVRNRGRTPVNRTASAQQAEC